MCYLYFVFISFFSLVKSSVLQERPEEHCSVREVELLHNSSHNVELEDCFRLYTKDEKVQSLILNLYLFYKLKLKFIRNTSLTV